MTTKYFSSDFEVVDFFQEMEIEEEEAYSILDKFHTITTTVTYPSLRMFPVEDERILLHLTGTDKKLILSMSEHEDYKWVITGA